MRRRFLAVAAVATTVVLTLAGCGGSASSGAGGDGGPYRVLVSAGLSTQGVLAANAKTAVLAARAGVKNINQAGGINGRQVKIEVVDDAGDPTTAITKLREAINSGDKPDLYLGSGPSNVAAAVLPTLKSRDILSFNIGPTENSGNPSKFPLNFDLSPAPAGYAKGFVARIQEQGYESVGIIHGNTAYGETFGPVVKKALQHAGIEVVGIQKYDTEALDMTSQLKALQLKKPDALVMDGYGSPVGYLLRSLKRLGWDVPVLGNTSVGSTSLISTKPPSGLLGTKMVDDVVVQVFDSTVYSESAEQVNTMVKTMSGLGNIPTTLILAYHYDAMPLVAAAAKQVGSADDPEALAEALEKPAVQKKAATVVLPRYGFSAESHSASITAEALTFVEPSPVVKGQYRTDQNA